MRPGILTAALAFLLATLHATEFGGQLPDETPPPQLLHHLSHSRRDLPRLRTLADHAHRIPQHGLAIVPLTLPAQPPHPAEIPDDLRSVHRQSRRLTAPLSGRDIVWELGNEPDFYRTTDLPDRIASAAKAAWWGIRQGHPSARILMPSLSMPPGRFAHELIACGLDAYTTGWNLHFYGWAHDLPAAVESHRAAMARHGLRLPLWITELGFAEMSASRSSLPVELDRQRAFFERTMAVACALKVDHVSLFSFGPYVDAGLDFGLFDHEGSPRPAFESVSTMAMLLATARPQFWIHHIASGERCGLVLAEPGPQWWTLLWSPHRRADFSLPTPSDPIPPTSLCEFTVHIPSNASPVRFGLDGKLPAPAPGTHSWTASASTNIHLRTPPHALSIDGCRLDPIPAPSIQPSRHSTRAPCPVVLEFKPDGCPPDRDAMTYRHPLQAFPFQIRLYNLATHVRHGRLQLHAPPSWRFDAVTDIPEIHVGPGAARTWTWLAIPPADASRRGIERWRAEWLDERGGGDVLAFGVECSERDLITRFTLDPLPLQAMDAQTSHWTFQSSAQSSTARLDQPLPGNLAGLVTALPTALQLAEDDFLRIRVRNPSGRPGITWRPELITSRREILRHGDPRPLHQGSVDTLEARVADFTPGLWSRGPFPDGTPVERVRCVRWVIGGLHPGDTVELGPVEIARLRRE